MSCLGTLGEVRENGSSGGVSSLQWKMPGFLSLDGGGGDCYYSRFFSACGWQWYLAIYPKGFWTDSLSDDVGLILVRNNFGDPLNLRITLSIQGTRFGDRKGKCQEFTNKNYLCQWNRVCLRSQLEEEESRLLQGDSFILTLDMKTEGLSVATDASTQTEESERHEIVIRDNQSLEKKDSFTQMEEYKEDEVVTVTNEMLEKRDKSIQVSSEVPQDFQTLSRDFSELFEQEILPDVKLECGGQTFQAHRSVLVARSKVFRAMFQNKMLESETGAVKIDDIDEAVLLKLLKFLYSGKIEDLSEDTTADLYEAADRYDVVSLKVACSYWIIRNLNLENCIEYLKVAHFHSDSKLKAEVMSFIIKHSRLMMSETWLALSKELPLLTNEVLQTYVASRV